LAKVLLKQKGVGLLGGFMLWTAEALLLIQSFLDEDTLISFVRAGKTTSSTATRLRDELKDKVDKEAYVASCRVEDMYWQRIRHIILDPDDSEEEDHIRERL
jgi:hypothetical protein